MRRPSADPERYARGTRLAVLGGVFAILLAGLIMALWSLSQRVSCNLAPLGVMTSFGLVSTAVFGFLAGHVLARWLEGPAGRAWAADPDTTRFQRGKLVVQVVLVAFLAMGAYLLWYEKVALTDTSLNWPITYYVRCFANGQPVPAGLGTFAITFLLGQWLWYGRR